jgi:hypothetical protein
MFASISAAHCRKAAVPTVPQSYSGPKEEAMKGLLEDLDGQAESHGDGTRLGIPW